MSDDEYWKALIALQGFNIPEQESLFLHQLPVSPGPQQQKC